MYSVINVFLFYTIAGLTVFPGYLCDDSTRIRVLHITDIHLDTQYVTGSESACLAPPCCRAGSAGSGEGGTVSRPARSFGEYRCDTPPALLQSALDAARQLKPDFIVVGGDVGPHPLSSEGDSLGGEGSEGLEVLRSRVKAAVAGTATMIKQLFPSDTPVFPVLGDMDFVPAATDPGPSGREWLTSAVLSSQWAEWLPQDARASLHWGGYYSVRLEAFRLRLVVLNTEVCHVHNFHTFVAGGLPASTHLHWLESVFAAARQAGERVLITGHIPPGVWSGCWGNYSAQYEEIVARFSSMVAGQIFGHQHSGSFRLLRSPSTSVTPAFGVAYVTPSLAAYKDQNPSFRLYELSGNPLTITNIEQYCLKLGIADADGAGGPLLWSPSFMPRAVLSIPDLTPNSWQDVLNRMWGNETFAKAVRATEANGREWMGNTEIRDYLCAITGVTDKEYIKCAGKSEEVMIRQYTGSQHTYVLTSMFPFHVTLNHFKDVLMGVDPSDVTPVF